MARIRSCKPEFYDNESIAELSLPARYLFRAMWHWLDKNGVGSRGAKYWKAKVFPYDEKIGIKAVEKCILDLVSQKRLYQIELNGKPLLFCPDMPPHQNFHRDEKPKYPISFEELKNTVQAQCEHSLTPLLAQQRSVIGDQRSEIGNQRSESFDFDYLYKKYPLKKGKEKGLERCKVQIKTKQDYDNLSAAIDRYKLECESEKKESQYIKHFSTFMNGWQDYLDDDFGQCLVVAEKTDEQKLKEWASE